jgi:hypothetical protein
MDCDGRGSGVGWEDVRLCRRSAASRNALCQTQQGG